MKNMQEQSPMLEAALDLLEQGFHVIPLGDGGTAKGKIARIAWKPFQKQEPTEEEVETWWRQWPNANIAIITGIDVVVVDADSQKAVDFMESGEVTKTPWKVKTRQGKHFYYQVNPNVPVTNSVSAKSIDIRGIGGYVVAPPSTHESYHVYEWENDTSYPCQHIMDLPALSESDLARVHQFNNQGNGEALADLSRVKETADGAAVAPGGRNNAAASLAGTYIQQGMSLAEVRQAVTLWNDKNPVPLSQSELDTTIASVTKTHMDNHPGQPVAVVPVVQQNPNPFFTFHEFQETPPEPPELWWNETALFRGARMLIAGGAKRGKSNFFLGFAFSAAIGGTFLGQKFSRPLKVMWMQAEIHKSFLASRFAPYTQHMTKEELGILGANFIASGRLRYDIKNPLHWKQITDHIQHYQPDLVCIDPFINFCRANENDNSEIHDVLSTIDQLEDLTNCAIAVLHHTGKVSSQKEPFNSIRGASAFRGWYDTGILLHGEDLPKGTSIISYELRNGPSPASHGTALNAETGSWEIVPIEENEPDQDDNEFADRIATALSILSKEPDGLPSGQLKLRLQKLTKLGSRSLDKILNALKNHPRITLEKRGNIIVYLVNK